MNDLKFEFISYTPTPNNPYMLGIITIRVYGKIELRYKNISKKDGSGTFPAPASYTIDGDQGREYISCFKINSEDDAIIMQLIRNHMNNFSKQYVQTEIEIPSTENHNLPF